MKKDSMPITKDDLDKAVDKAIKASEVRVLKMVEKMIQASEDRMLVAIQESERNTAELIRDLMGHIDVRFDRLEARMDDAERQIERVDNHSIRLYKLEAKLA